MKDKVYIVGAGAIGKALAVMLNECGRQAELIRGSVSNSHEKSETIEVSLNDGRSLKQNVVVSTFNHHQKFEGVVVLANKSFGNAAIADTLQSKIGDSPVVVMQNGLNIEEHFLNDHFRSVYRCVLFSTSQNISENVIRFKPVSPSPIGLVKGTSEDLDEIVSLLDTDYFRFQGVEDIQPIIWRKAIANCVFNSICPLLDVDNGIFHRDENARSLASKIIEECVAIAAASNIILDQADVLKTVLTISRSSDGQLISTLQDIRNKRPTEIDSLNFAILKIAMQLNMGDSVPTTKLLGELTKLKSMCSLSSAN